MRRVRYHAHGGPDVLTIEEADVPEPGPGQVLIRTEAIGTNYVDVQMRRETSPGSLYFRPVPCTLTGDVVGTVERVGAGADPGLVGTRVAALSEDGYADHVVAGADWLASVPAELDAGAATLLSMVGPMALGVLRTGRVAAGETVLITSGAGTIGHVTVQLAKRRGAGTVIATAGPAKLGFLKRLGADVAIDHTRDDWADQVRAAVPGGVNVLIDAVGGRTLHEGLGLLAPSGRAVTYGASAGDLTSVPVSTLFALKSLSGFALLVLRGADPDQARADMTEFTRILRSGELYAATETVLPLTEVVQAHRLMEDRKVLGRIVLVP